MMDFTKKPMKTVRIISEQELAAGLFSAEISAIGGF